MDIFGLIKKLGEGAVQAVGGAVGSMQQKVQPRSQRWQAPSPQPQRPQPAVSQGIVGAPNRARLYNTMTTGSQMPLLDPQEQVHNVAMTSQEPYAPVDPVRIAGLNQNTIPTNPAFVSYVMNKPEPWYQNALETERQAAQGWRNVLPIYLRNR